MKTFDYIIYQLYNIMDDNTLLFIFGDHGIKEDGNHGGGSFNEVFSEIIFTTKNNKFSNKNIRN